MDEGQSEDKSTGLLINMGIWEGQRHPHRGAWLKAYRAFEEIIAWRTDTDMEPDRQTVSVIGSQAVVHTTGTKTTMLLIEIGLIISLDARIISIIPLVLPIFNLQKQYSLR